LSSELHITVFTWWEHSSNQWNHRRLSGAWEQRGHGGWKPGSWKLINRNKFASICQFTVLSSQPATKHKNLQTTILKYVSFWAERYSQFTSRQLMCRSSSTPSTCLSRLIRSLPPVASPSRGGLSWPPNAKTNPRRRTPSPELSGSGIRLMMDPLVADWSV